MRKISFFVFLALFAMVQVVSAQGGSPLSSTNATAAVTIDGSDADAAWAAATWNDISVVFKNEGVGFTGVDDFTGKFKVADDANKVYFIFDITDDIITQDPDRHWAGDKVEIYFGLPGYDPAAGANGTSSRQIAIKAQVDPTIATESGSGNWPGSNDITTDGVEYSYIETAAGYMLEVSIDKVIVLEEVPGKTPIAFDISVADNDEIGATAIRYRKSWFNDGEINELWSTMEGAGQLILQGGSTALILKSEATIIAPAIDGDLTDAVWTGADWNDIATIFKGEDAGFTGADDFAGKFKVLDDGAKVYFAFDITDDIVTQDPGSHWAGDKVEIYFGLSGYDPSAGANGTSARQFAIKAQVDPTIATESGSGNWPGSNDITTDGVEYSYKETSTGYIMEVSIDKMIALEDAPSNTSLAFDVSVADNDETGVAKRYRKSWFNDGAINELWSTMEGAGKIKLSGVKPTVNPNRFEAELATVSGTTAVIRATSPVAGASSGGVVGNGNDGMITAGDRVSFTVNVKTAGEYNISFGYVAKWYTGSVRNYSLDVNGVFISDNDYSIPGGTADTYFNTPVVKVMLNAGTNKIDYYLKDGGKGWMFLDYIDVKEAYPTVYEAEDATLSGTSAVAQNPSPVAGASNGGVVGAGNDGMITDGDKVSFTVNVKAAGDYNISFGYAAKWYAGSGRSYSIDVNRTFVSDNDYSIPGGVSDAYFKTPAIKVTLSEGSNTIDYYLKNGGKGWMFLDNMEVVLYTSAENLNNTYAQSAYIAHDILRFKGFDDAVNAEVYSILGQKVLHGRNINEMNVSSLKNGIYIVRVGNQSFKVIK